MKIRIGFLNPANDYMLTWQDPDNPEKDYNLPYEAERSVLSMEKMGYEVLRYPGRLIEERDLNKFKSGKNSQYKRDNFVFSIYEANIAAKKFVEEKVDCVIFYMSSYFSPYKYLQAAKMMRVPIIIWAPEENIAGGLVLKGVFEEVKGIEFKFFYSKPDDVKTLKKIDSYIKATLVRRKLQESIYGKFGGRSLGLSQAIIDQYEFINIFGCGVREIDEGFLIEKAKNLDSEVVFSAYNKLKNEIKCMANFDEVFDRSLRLYIAFKEFIDINHFSFISFKCGSLMRNIYTGGCLAQNMLISEGMPTACNGDDRGALLKYLVKLFKKDSVAFRPDIYKIDKKSKKIYLRSDGIGPFNMSAEGFIPCLNYQYGLESPAGGICLTNVILKPGNVNLFWLNKINDEYMLHISEGESFIDRNDIELAYKMDCFSTKPPWGFIKLKGDIEKFIDNSNAAFKVVALGDFKQEFIYLAELLKIKTIFD